MSLSAGNRLPLAFVVQDGELGVQSRSGVDFLSSGVYTIDLYSAGEISVDILEESY